MQADYVVVGAGSAGCTVAARLSETGASVVLLEAGPSDWHPMIHIPAGMRSLIRNPLVNWNFTTEPENGTGDRDPRDQSATADRHDEGIETGAIAQHLKGNRTLPGNDGRIVVGVDERQPVRAAVVHGEGRGLLERGT